MVAAPSGPRGGGAIGGVSGGRGYSDRDSFGRTRDGRSGGIGGALKGAYKGGAIGYGVGGPIGGVIGGLGGALLGSGVLSGGFGSLGGLGSGRAGGALSGAGRGGIGGGGDAAGRTIMTRRASPAPGTVAQAMKKYTRPGNATPPGWMRFEPVMSDLQRRSMIATEGLSGNQGLYRSDEAKDYYKNLLGQTFISPLGQAQGDLGQLLPIEQQYLMALGIPEFKDVPGLLTALGY